MVSACVVLASPVTVTSLATVHNHDIASPLILILLPLQA